MKRYAVEDFFRNPEKSGFQLSPDGRYFSFMAPFENRMNVFVCPVDNPSNARQLTHVTDRDIAGHAWKGNDRLLFLKDHGGDENFALYAVNPDGSELLPLTEFEGVRTQFIDDLEDDADHIIVGLNRRLAQVFDPYRLNIRTGELKLIAENPGNISGWMTDHDGKLRMALATDGVNSSVLYRTHEEKEWSTLCTFNFKSTLSPLFFTFDNRDIYALSNIGRDKAAVIRYSIDENREEEVLFEPTDTDAGHLAYSRKRKVLTQISYTTDRKQRIFLDERVERRYRQVQDMLPGKEIAFTSANKDETVFIVRTFNDRSLGAYYLYDFERNALTLIEEVSTWLNEDHLCKMESVEYRSRDGLTIHGYLTLPVGVEARNLPVVVNPHGGPWARDYWGFNPEVQFLANRGYAVLQMNFRGSVGYGRAFWEASFKQWGKAMQDDISDGVQWLIDQGIADPKRVAIYGGSYGGYATLSGLAFTPDLYACGIDYVGVSNLFTFMKTIPPYWEQYLEMMYEMVGHPEQDQELLESASPVFHADRIVVPLLIAQGARDPRVNVEESNQMVAAMQERGIEVEYLVEEEEGHGFRNEENRFAFYRAMEQFLQQHLGA
ncbi:MAG: S9 family peptidase [Flavobacteriales bacterium]|nr:S9 family peptidase [Flavobacteriales bacterium]